MGGRCAQLNISKRIAVLMLPAPLALPLLFAVWVPSPALAAGSQSPAEETRQEPVSPQIRELLQDADNSLKLGNLDLGLIQLKNAVAMAPRNGAVRAPLGLALLRTGAAVTAMRELRQALADGGPEDVIVPAILEAMLIRGQTKDLLAEFSEPPQEAQGKTAVDILIARAKALQIQGQIPDANAATERALTLRRDAHSLVARATLATQQNNFKLAHLLADEAAKLAPDSDDVLMLTTSLLRQEGQTDKALAAMDAFLARVPQDVMARSLRVEILLELNRDIEAEAEVERLMKLSPNFTLASYYRALLVSRTGNAKEAWRIAQTLQPEFILLQSFIAMPVAQMAIAAGNPQTGGAILAALLSRHPEITPARLPLAKLQLSQGNAETALQTLEPIRSSGDPQVQATLAQAYLQLRRYGEAIGALDNATSGGVIGGQDLLKQQLALTALEYGDADRAVEELQTLAGRAPLNWGFVAPLIAALVTAGRLDDALALAERMERLDSRTPLGAFYRGQILALKGDLPAAAQSFEQAIVLDAKFLPALYYRARVSAARGNMDAARQDFRKILDQDAANMGAYLGLAQLALDEGKDAELRDVLAKAAKAAPNDPAPRLALANYQFAQAKYLEAQATVTAILKDRRDNPEALALQGQLQFVLGEPRAAIETFRSLAAGNPQSAAAYVLLAKALNATKDRLAAIDAARTAAMLAPYSAPVHAVLAESEIIAERPEDALNTARTFRAAHPGAMADLLLSDTLIRLKRLDEANMLVDRAHAAKPDRLLALRLSQIAIGLNDQKKAVAVLSAWLDRNPRDFDVRKQLAFLLLQINNPNAARKEFENLLQQRPEDPAVLNNLGWMIQDYALPRALTLVSLAAKISPRSVSVLDTLGWLKYRSNDHQAALPLLKQAHNLNAGDGEIAYHYAVVLDAAGQRGEAKALLESIMTKDAQFSDLGRAKQLLASWQLRTTTAP